MKDSTLILIAGIMLCFLTIVSVYTSTPLLISGILCLGGTGLVFAAIYEMTVNYN
jgi:hypothetical protein